MSTNVSYKKILETELKERQLAKKGFLNVSHWPIKKGYSLNELMNMSEDLMDLLNENEVLQKINFSIINSEQKDKELRKSGDLVIKYINKGVKELSKANQSNKTKDKKNAACSDIRC